MATKKPKSPTTPSPSSPGPADYAAERQSSSAAPGGNSGAQAAVAKAERNFSENLQLLSQYPKEVGPTFVGFIETLKGGGKQGQPSQAAPSAPTAPGPAQPTAAPAPRPAAPAGIPQQ